MQAVICFFRFSVILLFLFALNVFVQGLVCSLGLSPVGGRFVAGYAHAQSSTPSSKAKPAVRKGSQRSARRPAQVKASKPTPSTTRKARSARPLTENSTGSFEASPMKNKVSSPQTHSEDKASDLQVSQKPKRKKSDLKLNGYVMGSLGYVTPQEPHWSTQKLNFLTFSTGRFKGRSKWKLGVRGDYNFAYQTSDYLDDRVNHPKSSQFMFDETYIDTSFRRWDVRLGRQNIVWGELVGQYVADVVSARDLREFILPEIDQVRVPQWALLVERYKNDFHFQALYIPLPTFDIWPGEGDDYFPFSTYLAGMTSDYSEGDAPNFSFTNANWGVRAGYLIEGWDAGLFYYSSYNRETAVRRDIEIGLPVNIRYEREYYRVDQTGFTLTKDFDNFLFKLESVYVEDELLNVNDIADRDGLAEHRSVKLGLSFEPMWLDNGQTILQFTDKLILSHESNVMPPEENPYVALYVNKKYSDGDFEAEITGIYGLHFHDSLVRPRLVYNWSQNLRQALGFDVFSGPHDSPFGVYERKDRVYTNLKYFY